MVSQKVEELRKIDVHPIPLADVFPYRKNRHARRKEESLGVHESKHSHGKTKTKNWHEKLRKARKRQKQARRRNR